MLLRKWASYRRIRKYVKSHQSSNDRFWREAVVRRADDHAGSESLVDISIVQEGEGAGVSARIVDHAAARPPRSRAQSRRRAPVPGEHENGRRASSRARLVLRRLNWRGRKSAPSSVRMSKAISWTSSSCLRECRTLKSGTPSTPRMTASPSTN